MVTTVFQSLAEKADSLSVNSMSTQKAREWYRNEASKIRKINVHTIITPKNLINSLTPKNIGQLFLFTYDPKLKHSLPYYDRFPLVFPVNFYNDGFLGINLHYLPRKLRASLMDALYTTINNRKNDQNTRLRITYEMLNSMTSMRYYKPCLKRYLNKHVVQKFLYIEPTDWDKALMLPTERFVKKSTAFVHQESANYLRERL